MANDEESGMVSAEDPRGTAECAPRGREMDEQVKKGRTPSRTKERERERWEGRTNGRREKERRGDISTNERKGKLRKNRKDTTRGRED